MVDGFLGRWSQRKQAQRVGKAVDEPLATPLAKPPSKLVPPKISEVVRAEAAQLPAATAAGAPETPVAQATPALPTLDDVKNLGIESDFTPFLARDVAPEVRNAAMKKLFTDPRYNVMDGLDIYIDDYSRPDPLPESMLRQMVSAKFLNLFEDEKQDAAENGVRDDAHTPDAHFVAHSEQPPLTGVDSATVTPSQTRATNDDHTDLRLQQNHATGPQEPGRGTE